MAQSGYVVIKKWIQLDRTPENMALILKYLTVLSFFIKTVVQHIHNRILMYSFATKAELKTNWMS